MLLHISIKVVHALFMHNMIYKNQMQSKLYMCVIKFYTKLHNNYDIEKDPISNL